jgi:hypothetical protein
MVHAPVKALAGSWLFPVWIYVLFDVPNQGAKLEIALREATGCKTLPLVITLKFIKVMHLPRPLHPGIEQGFLVSGSLAEITANHPDRTPGVVIAKTICWLQVIP